MFRDRKILLLLALSLVACVDPPKQGPPKTETFYEIQPDLLLKAQALDESTVALIDSSGLLCYRSPLPWGADERGLSNYLLGHDIADLPAWHGMLMQAVAYRWVVTGKSEEVLLGRLIDGLRAMGEVTGVEGLIARSAIPDYKGARVDWMDTKESRPTKFWQQGPTGAWFRNGHAKNHWNMTISGLGVPLALHRAGLLSLSPELEAKLVTQLVAMVKRFKVNGWRLMEADGRWTEFGDLRPDVGINSEWPEVKGIPNGFNRMIVLNALASAAHYDADLKETYEGFAAQWGPGIKSSMSVVGRVIAAIGHQDFDKPSFSDMQAFSTSATCWALQGDTGELRGYVAGGLEGLWRFMEHEVNVPFNLARRVFGKDPQTERVVRLLRFFPGPDGKRGYAFEKKETSRFQPIENRPPNTNYWKSSPFRLALSVDVTDVASNPETGDGLVFAGADYLYAYWLGRWLQVVPER